LDTRSQAPQPTQENVKNTAINWVLVIFSICLIPHSILLKLSNAIKEKEYTYLIYEASIPGHDYCPSASCSGHSCDIKPLLPLLVYPLERKRVAYFVGLLGILCSWRLKVSCNP
jgi:hypothetical protein